MNLKESVVPDLNLCIFFADAAAMNWLRSWMDSRKASANHSGPQCFTSCEHRVAISTDALNVSSSNQHHIVASSHENRRNRDNVRAVNIRRTID